MKITRLYGAMDFRTEEAEEPICPPGYVKARTLYVGLCGSDRPRGLFGEVPFFPSTIGHEFSSVITEIGEGVTSVKVGDVVAVVPLMVCHKCAPCRTAHYGQCLNKKFLGLRVPDVGGFAEYNVLPEANVIKVPEGLSPIHAAMIEPVSVALHGIFRSGFQPGHDVAVVGAGTIGLLVIQALRAMGAKKIHVFDAVDSQLERAKRLGADYLYNTSAPDFIDRYHELTGGLGCSYVMEVVGIQETTSLALQLAAVNANIALIGYLDKPLAFNAAEVRKILEQEFNLIGVWQSYDLDFPGDAWRLGLEYLRDGKFDVEDMIDRVVTPDHLLDAFNDWRSPGKVKGKMIIDFTGSQNRTTNDE